MNSCMSLFRETSYIINCFCAFTGGVITVLMADGKSFKITFNALSKFRLEREFVLYGTNTLVRHNNGTYPDPLPKVGEVVEIEVIFVQDAFELYVNSHFLISEKAMHSPTEYLSAIKQISASFDNRYIPILASFLNISEC